MTRVTFVGGDRGEWEVATIRAARGDTLAAVPFLSRAEGLAFAPPADGRVWELCGVRSHERYLTKQERSRLTPVQEGLGRPASDRAALIPIRKSESWWELAQDERRAILEERSAHIAIGSRYLPAIARRLYHARDLGEPFDFLTWFEFSAVDAGAFDELVGRLRETEEWRYVIREVDVRLRRGGRIA